MKLTLPGLILAFFCISCQQNSAQKEIKSTAQQSSHNPDALIAELRRLQSACEQNDTAKITEFFSFPVADTALGVYFGEESVLISREQFLEQLRKVDRQINLVELSEILKDVNIDSLKYVNELEYNSKSDVQVDTIDCISRYEVKISGDTVRLNWYLNGYAEPEKVSEEGFPACEYGSYWEFLFNGKKLIFFRHMAAG